MEKLIQSYPLVLFVISVSFLSFSCAQQRVEERDDCRKSNELRIIQSCISRTYIDGPPLDNSADQLCLFDLLQYSKCSDR